MKKCCQGKVSASAAVTEQLSFVKYLIVELSLKTKKTMAFFDLSSSALPKGLQHIYFA
jgi:hypothetical protein